MFKKISRNGTHVEFLNLCAATAAYILLLFIPPPPIISRLLGEPTRLILLILFGFIALLFRQKSSRWGWIQSAFVFILFAIPLIYKWQFAQFDDFLLGGLQPWSDASAYLLEAQRLLHGLLLTAVGARRPLFHSYLATLLNLSGGNFMVTLAILTWVNALAVYVLVREVNRIYGTFGASFLLLFAYEFYQRFAGTTMTEQLGFALGNLAVFLLLRAAQNKNLKLATLGLTTLSLALIARAGAFFILPTLVVWIAVTLRSNYSKWRAAGLALAVVITAFLLNTLLVKTIAEPGGTPFSNYSYTLYGLASGNEGWTKAMADHPSASEGEIMYLALNKIRTDPALFLKGMLRSNRDYFTTDRGAFTFISFGNLQKAANFILWGLIATGLVFAILNWNEGIHGLVLASFIGVIASIALVPPIDANDMRAFAATIPFTALWIVEGGFALISWGRKILNHQEDRSSYEIRIASEGMAIGFTALLIVLAIPAPILLRSLVRPPNGSSLAQEQTTCEAGQQLLQGSMLKNTGVILIDNESASESYMPFIRTDDYRSAIKNKNPRYYPFLDSELLGLQTGQQISLGFDLNAGNDWFVSSFPIPAGTFRVCGSTLADPDLLHNGFYNLNGSPLSPATLTISQQYPQVTQLIRLLYALGICTVFFCLY